MNRPFDLRAPPALPPKSRGAAHRTGFRRLARLSQSLAAFLSKPLRTVPAPPSLPPAPTEDRATDLAHALAATRAELAQAQAELAAARDAVARAEIESAAKSRFLAEMSHELRTPLNAVIGFSEMMAQEVLGAHAVPAYGDYARDIHTSGRHLLALADDVLDLARIEIGHRSLLETAVALGPLAGECLQMIRPAAAARPVFLSCRAEPEAPRLWADERALRQIVLNLLGNAVKFTPAGGAVHLSVGCDADGVSFIAVEDTGPGIGEAELPLALSAHPRESALDPVSGRGAGLGLAIVRGLAELHGGALTLARRPAGGTRACVHLPAARRLETPRPAAGASPLRAAAE